MIFCDSDDGPDNSDKEASKKRDYNNCVDVGGFLCSNEVETVMIRVFRNEDRLVLQSLNELELRGLSQRPRVFEIEDGPTLWAVSTELKHGLTLSYHEASMYL